MMVGIEPAGVGSRRTWDGERVRVSRSMGLSTWRYLPTGDGGEEGAMG